MAVKTDRMEARVSSEERERIERAASAIGLSVSAFLVSAAVDRAEEIIAATTTTSAPPDFFNDLLAALDVPESAPRLAKASKDARRHGRIEAR
ncbi:MAG: DUF1778 domain-containing protein [Acidimicrobiales bacterium]